jgi:hypothetical protein
MKRLLLLVPLLLTALFVISVDSPKASALSGSEFQAGRIIDDGVFFNGNGMDSNQIQAFLNSKVPTCDTSHARSSSPNDSGAPYTCLKDYRQNTWNIPSDAYCNGFTGGNKSAAQIIYEIGVSCGINQKVILITLQKEQSLITDNWPWAIQYEKATGYACPDTAPCDSNFSGFFRQVYYGARQFKRYTQDSNIFTSYRPYRNNFIQYHPNSSCNGTNVYVQNQATSNLYIYTPYQPNAAALNNLYTTGDGCSSYGNRNFWRMFNDWFGSTTDNIPTSSWVRLVSPISLSPAQPSYGDAVTVSFTVQNFDPNNIAYVQGSVVQCRFNSYTNCDSNYGGAVEISPGQQRTFTYSVPPMAGGDFRLTPYFVQNGIWQRFGNETSSPNSLSLSVPDVRIVTPVTLTPNNPIAGESVGVSFTVRNFGTQVAYLQTSVIQCRRDTSNNCDSNYGGSLPLSPGEQRTFSYGISALSAGSHRFIPYFMQGNNWYRYGYGIVGTDTINRDVPDIRFTGPITTSPAQPIPGQPMTVNYTVQNYGSQAATLQGAILQCRFNTNTNCDPADSGPITINAGAQKIFSITIPPVKAGRYVMTPYFMLNNAWYHYNGTATGGHLIQVDVPAYVADMRLTGNITSSPSQPIPGQPMTVSYTVKNFGDQPAIYQDSILQCRFNTYTNCDPADSGPITINAGAQRTFTETFPAASAGTYVFTPFYSQNESWYRYSNGAASNNLLQLNVPAYVADMRLTGNITVSPSSPSPGQAFSVSYTVKNFGDQPAIYQDSILQCRRNNNTNCDTSYDGPLTINAGSQRTFTVNYPSASSGTYTFVPYYMQNNSWYKYGGGFSNSTQLVVN